MTKKTLKQLLSNGESESIEFKTTQKTRTREKILEILHANPSMTREELASVLGKSPNTIKEHIAKLKADGRLVCVCLCVSARRQMRHAQAG